MIHHRTSWKACVTIPTRIPPWLNQLHLPSLRARIFHHYHTHAILLPIPRHWVSLPHASRWHLFGSQLSPGKPPLGALLKMQFATVFSIRLLTHGEGMSHVLVSVPADRVHSTQRMFCTCLKCMLKMKVTQCAGRVSANTRLHQLRWSDREWVYYTSCKCTYICTCNVGMSLQ